MVFPIFLTMMLGITAYGIYIAATHSLAQLAADAARASVEGLTNTERERIARSNIALNASNYPLLKTNKITVQAGPLASDANQFRVALTYNAESLPIWGFATFLPLPSKIIVRSAVIKRGGY